MISGNVFRSPVLLITRTGQGLWEVCLEIYLSRRMKYNSHETQVWSTALCKEILQDFQENPTSDLVADRGIIEVVSTKGVLFARNERIK